MKCCYFYLVHQTTSMNILVPTTVPPPALILFTLTHNLSFFFALHSLNTKVTFKIKCFVYWSCHSLRHLKRVNQLLATVHLNTDQSKVPEGTHVKQCKCYYNQIWSNMSRKMGHTHKAEDCILINSGSKREASMCNLV